LARPYRALVLFSANDIKGEEGDKSPLEVARMFQLIVAESKKRQPDAPIFIIAITPNEKRWGVWAIQKMANDALRKVCESDQQLHFIATEDKYLTSRGFPRKELFVEDKLHQNADGYRLWASIIQQHLNEVLKTPRTENP
jgi:lysophospholipase L1-like esterase